MESLDSKIHVFVDQHGSLRQSSEEWFRLRRNMAEEPKWLLYCAKVPMAMSDNCLETRAGSNRDLAFGEERSSNLCRNDWSK